MNSKALESGDTDTIDLSRKREVGGFNERRHKENRAEILE